MLVAIDVLTDEVEIKERIIIYQLIDGILVLFAYNGIFTNKAALFQFLQLS